MTKLIRLAFYGSLLKGSEGRKKLHEGVKTEGAPSFLGFSSNVDGMVEDFVAIFDVTEVA